MRVDSIIFKAIDFFFYRLANCIVKAVALLPRKRINKGKHHILLISNDFIGDALVRMPFYRALREAMPNSHISVALSPAVANLFVKLPYFDSIISTDTPTAHPIKWVFSKRRIFNTLLRWAWRQKVDVVVNLVRLRTLELDYIIWLSNPRQAIGYDSAQIRSVFPSSYGYQKKHCDRLYVYMLNSCAKGIPQIEDLQNIYSFLIGNHERLKPVDANVLAGFWRTGKISIVLSKPYCVLVPGANAAYRRWPAYRFAKTANHILKNHPKLSIVVVGSKSERKLGENIVSSVNGEAVNVCGETSLPQLGAVLAGASCVITNETGTATYAAIIGAPTVCILGGGDFGAFFPTNFYPNTRSVYHKESCFYCRWQCTKGCGQNTVAPCIDSITVDDVYAQVKELLRTERP